MAEPEYRSFSFWFAHGENPCHVALVGPSAKDAFEYAASKAYEYLTARYGRFPFTELALVIGTSEPLLAADI